MKTQSILLLCVLGFACFTAIHAEDHDDGYVHSQEQSHEGAAEAKIDQQEAADGDKQKQSVWFACFVLTKNYLANNNEPIYNALKGPKYQIYYKKLVARSLMSCLNNLPYDEAFKFLESIQKQGGLGSIDIQSYFHYLAIDLNQYRDGKISASITKDELAIFNAAEELEKNLNKQQRGGEGAEDEETGSQQGYKFDPNIFGVNLQQTSGTFKAMYMLAIFGALGLAFYIVYQYLFGTGPRSHTEKLLAEKKKKKEEKKKAKGQ